MLASVLLSMLMSLLNSLGINTAYADTTPVQAFVGRVNQYITNPLIILMFAAALAYFLYGVVMFIVNSDDAGEREVGKSHILWGLVGMFIMFSVFVILRLIENTFGIDHNPSIQ